MLCLMSEERAMDQYFTWEMLATLAGGGGGNRDF